MRIMQMKKIMRIPNKNNYDIYSCVDYDYEESNDDEKLKMTVICIYMFDCDKND